MVELQYRTVSVDLGDWAQPLEQPAIIGDLLTQPAAPAFYEALDLPEPRPRKVLNIHASYLRKTFDDPQQLADTLHATLYRKVAYDTLVGSGLSGALVVPAIARILEKNWLIVRKPNDGSHSHRRAEGSLGQRWLFVDDLVDSGRTWKRVTTTVRDIARDESFQTQCVGAYTYNYPEFRRPEQVRCY